MERKKIIEALANKATDNADMEALLDAYYENEYTYLETLSDAQLAELVAENLGE